MLVRTEIKKVIWSMAMQWSLLSYLSYYRRRWYCISHSVS